MQFTKIAGPPYSSLPSFFTLHYFRFFNPSRRPSWYSENGLGSLGGIHFGSKYIVPANNVDASSGVTSDIILVASIDEGIPGIRRLNTTFYPQYVCKI